MKTVFESVIREGNYDLTRLLKNIDRYHIVGKLTDEERDELYALARQDAAPQYDTADEINRLWTAVHELRDAVTALQAGAPEPEPEQPTDEWPEYVQPTGAHDAYRVGDRVVYKGKHYVCGLDGCVWAPDVYPAGWTEVD